MVEMQELSRILHAATERSLSSSDEVGARHRYLRRHQYRVGGHEHIHNECARRPCSPPTTTRLTALADHLGDDVANVHVAAEERDGEVTFLRTVRDGATDRSYGVHVADLAGVPDPVVERSQDVINASREPWPGLASERVQAVADLDAGEFGAGGRRGQ